jgi:hypothetical protein
VVCEAPALRDVCSFRGWIESAVKELRVPKGAYGGAKNSLEKRLQFPTVYDATGNISGGVKYGINQIKTSGASAVLSACFTPTMRAVKKNSFQKLDELLICYRAFKEVRNNFFHHGGIADQKSEDAYHEYDALLLKDIGLKEKPALSTVVKGQPVTLSVRGVVGFSDVVLRLIYSLDCELSDSAFGEQLLKTRWLGIHPGVQVLSTSTQVRDAALSRLTEQCGFPKPIQLATLYQHMKAQGLVL